MTGGEILLILLIVALFDMAPRTGCACGVAACFYLYSIGGLGDVRLLIGAGIFAIGVAITNLKDLELKLTDNDGEVEE